MFLILRFFNSILFVIANLSVALYTLQRFFRAMKSHYQLVDEVEQFNSLVNQSRASLNYVSAKVIEAMKEMEMDIGREVYVTHNLTNLSSKISAVSKRFNELEEGIIELARLSHNMENATVETPSDINEEVRRIMTAAKRKSASADNHNHQLQLYQQRPRSPSPRKASRKSRSHGAVTPVATPPSPVSKFSAAASGKSSSPRSRSPCLVPEVMLLNEKRTTVDKPIGFRPPWMCEV